MVNKVFSIEDGNQQTTSAVTARKRLYKDIDLSFAKAPSNDVYKKSDLASIKQAIKNLLQTNHHEKPFKQNFGANLRGLLFELSDDFLEYEINEAVVNAVNN